MINIEKVSLFENQDEMRELCLRLAKESSKDVGWTYEWISPLWESHFGKEDKLTLLMRDANNEPLALLPFFETTEHIKGLKVKIIKPITELYSTCGGLLISRNEEDVLSALLSYFKKEHQWDILQVCVEANTKLESAIKKVIKSHKYKMECTHYESSPFLSIGGEIDNFLASKSRNFRSNLKRKEKKIIKAGDLQLKVCTEPSDVEQSLKEIFEIEDKSWKVAEGTAITSVQRRQDFYSMLAERTAKAGWLRIYILSLDNKPIAYDFSLLFENRYFMLKTSYDEAFGKLSPGVVLRWYVVEDLFKIGCAEHNFLWGKEPYKMQWSDGVREFYIYRIYNQKAYSSMLYYMTKFLSCLRRI